MICQVYNEKTQADQLIENIMNFENIPISLLTQLLRVGHNSLSASTGQDNESDTFCLNELHLINGTDNLL